MLISTYVVFSDEWFVRRDLIYLAHFPLARLSFIRYYVGQKDQFKLLDCKLCTPSGRLPVRVHVHTHGIF